MAPLLMGSAGAAKAGVCERRGRSSSTLASSGLLADKLEAFTPQYVLCLPKKVFHLGKLEK